MTRLNKHSTKAALQRSEVRPSKTKGQNFVVNPGVIHAIVDFGNPRSDEHIVEIGPGLGALTRSLTNAASLTLLELEPKFCEELKIALPDALVVQTDARSFDFRSLKKKVTVFGNIPYVYSTDILFHLLDAADVINRIVLLLQKEFADRVAAGPGSKTYGILSIMAQVIAESQLGPIIDGDNFFPPTKVQSRVLELRIRPQPLVEKSELEWFRKVVRAAFHERRKKIYNSLKAFGIGDLSQIDEALIEAHIDRDRRAESLSIEEFLDLSRALGKTCLLETK